MSERLPAGGLGREKAQETDRGSPKGPREKTGLENRQRNGPRPVGGNVSADLRPEKKGGGNDPHPKDSRRGLGKGGGGTLAV